MRALAIAACALAGSGLIAGCGGEERRAGSPDPSTEPADEPAAPPRGWRTIAGRSAGFTLSVPRGWTVRRREGATLVRSRDRLLVATLAADRSEAGRERPARRYAHEAFRALPGFRRLRAGRVRSVRDSPYESARVDGTGTLRARRQPQRIAVAAFRRPGRVTYTAVVFGARLRRGAMPHARALERMLASFRARPPAL